MTDKPKWINETVKGLNYDFAEYAKAHQNNLTKPPGSLGELEKLAIKFATWQETLTPSLELLQILIFAADHGIAEENVSAFPQAVTAEMIRNFSASGAAISVLANFSKIPLKVLNMGTVEPLEPLPSVEDCRIGPGTQSFLSAKAMTKQELEQALDCGRQQAEHAAQRHVQLLIAGEMGIANTTSASAIAAALFNLDANEITGRGTGLDDQGVQHKARIINRALSFHQTSMNSPLDILQIFGGFEIAAMTGCYLRSAQLGVPMLIDGFISTIAAIIAIKIKPEAQDWMIFAHCSAERGHQVILDFLQVKPLLDLNLRLGEGSGAALAVPMLQAALALNNQMATFEQANVSKN